MRKLRLKLWTSMSKSLDFLDCVFIPLVVIGLVVFSLFAFNNYKERLAKVSLELYVVNNKLERILVDYPEIKKEIASIETIQYTIK